MTKILFVSFFFMLSHAYAEVFVFPNQCSPGIRKKTILKDEIVGNCLLRISCVYNEVNDIDVSIISTCDGVHGFYNFGNPLSGFKSRSLSALISRNNVFLTTLDVNPEGKVRSRMLKGILSKSEVTLVKSLDDILLFEDVGYEAKLFSYKQEKCTKKSYKLKFLKGCFSKQLVNFE